MSSSTLIPKLQEIVGSQYVLTDPAQTLPFREGYRFGSGNALAVVRPATLLEQWRVLQACVDAGVIVISQAANTGLTGGSTPSGNDYDRDIVIINTMRNDGIQLINNNEQAVCLPGSTNWNCCSNRSGANRTALSARRASVRLLWAACAITRAARWCNAGRPTPKWRCTHKSTPLANWNW